MNRATKSLLGVVIPPVLVFILCYLIIRIDIYSTILLTVVTLFITLIVNRTNRTNNPRLTTTNSVIIESDLADLMKKAQSDMDSVIQVAKKVKSKEVSENAMILYQLGVKIMVYLERNPHKITKARRFFNYYLETARDILAKYYEFELTGIKAPEIENIEVKTTGALTTLHEAFRKEYVRLATNEMMDIEADIDLLEKTNKSE